MATISGTQGNWRVDLIVNETSTDINTNTSTASWELWIRRIDSGNYPMYGTPTVNIYVSGQHVYSASKYYSLGSITNSGVKLESGTVSNLPHNNSTGVINNNTASFTWTGSGFSPNNVSGNGTYETATIPRNSTITATSAYIEETSQLTITNYKPDEYTFSIAYSFGNLSGYILANGTTTSTETKLTSSGTTTAIGFPIPYSWYSEIPNDQYGTCTLTIKTYNGDTQIGNDYQTTFSARVKPYYISHLPTATATVRDANDATYALTGNRNILIKGYSTAEVTWTATPTPEATVRNVKINGKNAFRSPYSFTLTDTDIHIMVTDSRMMSNGNDMTYPEFTLKNYSEPTMILASIERPDPTSNYATLSFTGTWFNQNFGSQDNTLSLSWKYRETGTNNWITGDNLTNNTHYKVSGNNFWSGTGSSASEINIGGNLLSYEKNWDILLIATDKLASYQVVGTLAKGIPIINWEEDFFNVNGSVRCFNQDIIETDTNSDGTYIVFYDGTLICYKTITANVSMTTAWGSLYEGTMDLGNWPVSFISKPHVQITNGSATGAIIESYEIQPTTSNAGQIYLVRPNSYTSNVSINVFAIGRWK